MTEVISVKFKNRGKVYFFDPHGIAVRTGEKVVVETSRGLELAENVLGNHAVPDETVVQPLRSLARIATKDDLRIEEIWPPCSATASSCARSACATRRR